MFCDEGGETLAQVAQRGGRWPSFFCFNAIHLSNFIFPSICTITFLISVLAGSNHVLESPYRG